MDIQSRVNFGWTKQKGFPQVMSFLKSQDCHILCRVDFGWTKYRGVIHVCWSGYMASGYIFTSSKKVTDYL